MVSPTHSLHKISVHWGAKFYSESGLVDKRLFFLQYSRIFWNTAKVPQNPPRLPLYNPACQTKSKVQLQKIREYSFWKLRTVNTIPIRRGCWYVKILLYYTCYQSTTTIWKDLKHLTVCKVYLIVNHLMYMLISRYIYIYLKN